MTSDTIGGVWTYAIELIRELGKQGVEVAMATMGAPLSLGQAREVRGLQNLQVFESDFKLEWMQNAWADVDEAGRWLLFLEDLLSPDIVHLNGYVHGALAWKAPTVVAAHSCVLSWWRAVNGEAAPEEWSTYKAKVRQGLQAADMVVAPSRSMLSDVESIYGVLDRKRVIYNGRSDAGFDAGQKEELVFAAGRLWDKGKNIEALSAAAPGLSWPVAVAGEQAFVDGAAPAVVELRNVQLIGRLEPEQLAEWYSRAAIYVLPARYEPFGLTALEAGLSGCALVLGDIPSLREIWGDAAVFVDPDESLRASIQDLIDRPSYHEEMSRKAYRRASEFTARRMSDSYLDVYQDLITLARYHASIPQEVGVCA